MTKSARLRPGDWRTIAEMTGEACEQGNDAFGWRDHWLARLAKLTDSSMGHSGEMQVCEGFEPKDMGVAVWGHQEGFVDPVVVQAQLDEFRTQPNYFASLSSYFRIQAEQDGVCLARTDFIHDDDWYGSTDHLVVQSAFGVEHIMYCHRSIVGGRRDEVSGVILNRALGMREYSLRDRAIVREAHDALTPFIGRSLARFHEPSPHELAPRVRQVLACLLEGDSDKQIAVRLDLSRYTVNQYTKRIFKHFGTSGRAELLSRWIRRDWSLDFTWVGATEGVALRPPAIERNHSTAARAHPPFRDTGSRRTRIETIEADRGS
ncbi:MAG: helix-turn-helix transcriptional regulator [Paludisphaera borealis]|uniref:helix-turn-helix transcriptional regulator n=1 Tax=Paludisphaera borealis TaxID=1387353 RepID=UPI002840B160|nr:helix-turn-helix transcriptional regulator [Paludisphaera borealis]MDR3620012.1 helix-turn-helix transcriptional regulator [Paludisphaera borealis]